MCENWYWEKNVMEIIWRPSMHLFIEYLAPNRIWTVVCFLFACVCPCLKCAAFIVRILRRRNKALQIIWLKKLACFFFRLFAVTALRMHSQRHTRMNYFARKRDKYWHLLRAYVDHLITYGASMRNAESMIVCVLCIKIKCCNMVIFSVVADGSLFCWFFALLLLFCLLLFGLTVSLSFQKCGWLAACEAIFVYSSRNSRSLLTEFRRAAVLLFVVAQSWFVCWFFFLRTLSLSFLLNAHCVLSSLGFIRFIALFLLAQKQRRTYRSHERNVHALSLDWLHSPNTHL